MTTLQTYLIVILFVFGLFPITGCSQKEGPTSPEQTPTYGQGAFGPQRVISTAAFGARSVYAADLDGDNDIDVLSASFENDKIAWYENTDGLGSFGAQRVISATALGAFSVFAADLDGDGDPDVLSASFENDKIAWYENTDGLGSFGAQQVITSSAFGASSVYAADLDGDDDIDVLSASFENDKIAWYENTGAQLPYLTARSSKDTTRLDAVAATN